MNIGQEIYSQLLHHRNSLWCWGAKTFRTFSSTSFAQNLAHRGGLFFTVSGLKFKGKVMIRVLGSDLYHVAIGKMVKGEWIEKQSVSDIYCEDLESTIDDLVEGTINKSPSEVKQIYDETNTPYLKFN